jgi:ankyrin repeat protein
LLQLLSEVNFAATIDSGKGRHNVLHEACSKDLDLTLGWLIKRLTDEQFCELIWHKSNFGKCRGETPFHVAAKKGSLACMKLLINRLRDFQVPEVLAVLNECDANQETMLHLAATSHELTEYLMTLQDLPLNT